MCVPFSLSHSLFFSQFAFFFLVPHLLATLQFGGDDDFGGFEDDGFGEDAGAGGDDVRSAPTLPCFPLAIMSRGRQQMRLI